MNLKPLDEYVAYDQTQQAQSDVDADIVFVGYGIEAPEYNWDDYKGVDVKGKTLVMLVNDPPVPDPAKAGDLDPQTFGGRVASSLNGQGQPLPAASQYAIRASIGEDAAGPFLQKTVTGVLHVEGRPESILARLWRQTLKVLVRESGV